MPEHIRALIFIFFITVPVCFYAKRAFEPMLMPEEFTRLRNAWFAITLLAFLSHNFWLFIALSSAYLLYIARSEQNKFALYFALLIIIPPMAQRIPSLFDVNYVRILSLTILLPFFIAFRGGPNTPSYGKPLAEKLMLAYMFLSTILMMRGTTVTDALRFGFYGFTDFFLPYFAASRAIKDFQQLKKVMIAFLFACFIAAAIGAFEFSSGWLLYSTLPDVLQINWGFGNYLGRGDSLRAFASLGHSLTFGFVIMVALGFYIFIAPSIKSKIQRLAGFGLIFAGLISSLSRGPWVGTAVLLLVIIAFGRNAIKRLVLVVVMVSFTLPFLNWIPGGEKVINLIPFIGQTDKFNVDYREKLIDKSMLIIEKHPLFGVYDVTKEPEMADMIQGEGIVDIVNTYIGVMLGSGLVGLALLLGYFALLILTIFKGMLRIADKQSEEFLCGRTLLASLLAILVTIFTMSSIGIVPSVLWSIAGLIFSYVRVTNPSRVSKTDNVIIEKTVYPTTRLKNNS
jgi:O-antigen ligase